MAYSHGRRDPKPLHRRVLRVIVPLTLIALAAGWFAVGPAPEVSIEPAMPGIGPATPVTVVVEEPRRGAASYRLELEHAAGITVLGEHELKPRRWWALWAPRIQRHDSQFVVGRETVESLQEGSATLRVVAQRAGTWLRQPDPVVTEIELPVVLTPPRVAVVRGSSSVSAGGSGVVVYRVGARAVEHGVRLRESFAVGYPLPAAAEAGQDNLRFALFGLPWNLASAEDVRLEVRDELGNMSRIPFLDAVVVPPAKSDTIRVPDSFLERVVPAIQEREPGIESSGDLLADYLVLNNDVRAANAATLRELTQRTAADLLWQGPFRQLPDSQVMAGFAEQRTYLYEGEEVDRQVHLGYDLASVRRAPVPASNAGMVLFAGFLGIYGNTVVVDHGHGLMTLYSHLSGLEVEEGQAVRAGQSLGRTGITGLAGGDHLHFSVLLHGVFVNPLEWWDPRWVEREILQTVLAPQGGATP